jgi:DNA polymerase III subunit gamma/tau
MVPVLTGEKEMVVEQNETVFQNKPYTLETIKQAIHQYAGELLKLGNKMLHVTLTTCGIELLNDKEIVLTLTNEVENERLLSIKQEFLDEIRKTIQNNTVTLSVKLSEAEVVVKAFKPSDKFKQMAEKYPALLELKKRFDLEIDY